jgi:hypothetical protein
VPSLEVEAAEQLSEHRLRPCREVVETAKAAAPHEEPMLKKEGVEQLEVSPLGRGP